MSQAICTAATPDEEPTTPPSVKIPSAGKVLSAGIDTVEMSLSIIWKRDDFLKMLRRLQADARAQSAAMPGIIEAGPHTWVFNVEPAGTKGGYTYLLTSREYQIKLLDRMIPIQRPSAVITIASVALWQTGVIEAIDRILHLLQGQGADIVKAMASRSDPCTDMLLPESIWTPGLEALAVTAAKERKTHKNGRLLTGFTFGKNGIALRLYDKAYEIETKSKKYWMYDIWGLKEVPPGGRIVRVEFQLRREVLRELGIDSIWDLVNYPRSLWAYCTENWLSFQDRPDLHHTQQKTLEWWKTVQGGFLGGQRACPLIRAKTVDANKFQLSQQLFGQLSSLIALDSDGDVTPGGEIQIEEPLSKVIEGACLIGMDPSKFYEKVRRKIAKYAHDAEKFSAAQKLRKEKGLPVLRTRQSEKGGAE